MGGVHGDSLDRCGACGVRDGLDHFVRDGRTQLPEIASAGTDESDFIAGDPSE
jgi:hypothetical protein